ncbi:MAG: hypothetical protein R3F39_00210 [Myxococcota bacterium]
MRRVFMAGVALALCVFAPACEERGSTDPVDADAKADSAGDAGPDAELDAAPETVSDGGADAATDADSAADAETSPDADPDAEVLICAELATSVEAALSTAASGCASPLDCALFEYPICGSFGCFTGAVRQDADLTTLSEVTASAGAAGCEPFHCGCDPPPGTPVCLGGSCALCPPVCGTDCGALELAFRAAAAESAAGCTKDSECQATTVAHCALGPQLACHTLAWRTDPAAALKLLDGYLGAAGCADVQCDCQFEGARCDAGTCVPGPKPAVECGTTVVHFPDFADDCTDVAECALVTHGTDCCGNAAVWGLRADEVAAFNAAESSCQSQIALCACPAMPPVAEDGSSAWEAKDFAVRCQAGHCESYVPAP